MENQQIAEDENNPTEIISDDDKTSAVNSSILEYYKKFGKKRDLEQYFSLTTAQSEIRDPSSLFWRQMKALSDSSDSGDKKSESSTELCKISIRCSVPEHGTSKLQEDIHDVIEVDSPPIITEVCQQKHSDNESDGIHSLKSVDGTLDLSINKPHSPTSSVTSQRKLEWDSLGDVGYGNESGQKITTSNLSTLERLALQQQYCINDTQLSSLGVPTAQSTPLEPNNMADSKSCRKASTKKSTIFSNKDIDFIEMTLPQIPEINQAINLNLTKHITFNVDKNGEINVENISKNISSSPEKVSVETYMTPEVKFDKEIQTSIDRNHLQSYNIVKNPVSVNLNTLKKRQRRKKLRKVKSKPKSSKEYNILHKSIAKDKGGEQISAAESFEYMPGHIYNQKHGNIPDDMNIPKKDNKSSLESSTGITTDSSKEKKSFTKDLEKSIDLLKITLKRGQADDEIKKKLIKEIVQRLLKTRYKDDESTDFLSGLSFESKKLDLGVTSTSNSDSNNTAECTFVNPTKSILRTEKFNSNLPSTTQSTPNIPSTIKRELAKAHNASNTDSDQCKDAKTSSEELYQKYLKALKREQAYKQHLKQKDSLYKQKLVGSDLNIDKDVKVQNRIKDLMKDLVRNNYDDGSGDASKLEGGSFNNIYNNRGGTIRNQKSHSVFTLSSGTSNCQPKSNTKKADIAIGTTATSSKSEKYHCCCHLHTHKVGVADSSVQVNIQSWDKQHNDFNRKQTCSEQNEATQKRNIRTNELKYVCLCKETDTEGVPDNILIYKCSQLDACRKGEEKLHQSTHCAKPHSVKTKGVSEFIQSITENSRIDNSLPKSYLNVGETSSSKSSQTHLNLEVILREKNRGKSDSPSADQNPSHKELHSVKKSSSSKLKRINEAVRWTQTDISINPKISDPSFSDINIINNKDCAKLVSETHKEVSLENIRTSSDELTELVTDSSAKSLNRLSSSKQSSDVQNKNNDKQTQSDVDISTVTNIGSQCDLQKKLKYSIPIEGTNMTLKVSLGDNMAPDLGIKPQNEVTKRPILKTKETLTCGPTTTDNSTSLLEECSVGVQSSDNNIFDEYYQKTVNCGSKSCKEALKIRNEAVRDLTREETPEITSQDKFHTYPKGNTFNPLKPLLRSNTDTSRIEKSSHVTFDELKQKLESDKKVPKNSSKGNNSSSNSEKASDSNKESQNSKTISDSESQIKSHSSSNSCEAEEINDPLIDLIQNITKRYSKKDINKSKRKKCFKEIITVLNYLLDTDESSDQKPPTVDTNIKEKESQSKEFADKGVQLSKSKKKVESSDPTSSDLPTTSTDSTAYHVLNKIKKECERYQQKRCKSHRKLEESSSTSMNFEYRREHCYCKTHKCKHKQNEKSKKKCLAYNLIVQSDSLASEETICESTNRPLRNIIVKVPKKKYENVPLKEMCAKLEREVPHCSRVYRSRSLPNDSEVSSTEDMMRQTHALSVREYLERNRPDFVENCSQRQNCLKAINERRSPARSPRMNMIIVHTPKCNSNQCTRNRTMYNGGTSFDCNNCRLKNLQCVQNAVCRVANERATKRQLLSVQVGRQQTLSAMSDTGLQQFAMQFGKQLRTKKLAPKFISERDMKKHSMKIYKSLPEVVNKKEELKKESVKKTNLLLARIFKKNLQKRTLQGAVNLSNYSTVIKI